ncbi:MAG: 1-acyl-sn-glycerol-3-phosphate acyltransferase [Prevotellaceae bacterium]|nr:1-acyl-sn-glycerol-3-phosphate acyltransferase [Prevotellaceae bacterium]MDO4932630.1 1-acyl-sn-glycerol-3-phosphate acyltransferase [Prevotellaceae bacterium]
MTPNEFNDIRPYNEDEMPVIFNELLEDRQFNHVLKSLVPGMPKALRNSTLRLLYRGVRTSQDFQIRIMKPIVRFIIWKCTKGLTFNYPGELDKHGRYIFLSNHRDIVLDSAFLDVALFENGFDRTVEIGIGDNLLIYPWIKKLVRMNKAFTVRRGLTAHEMMRSSMLMSQYIHYAVNEKQENIWIAQREGRAKDSDDRTQDAVLKMFCLGAPPEVTKQDGITAGGSVIEALKHLHIAPLAISYEYDPCDYLKAEEFQFKRDVQGWKKSKGDDLNNMKTGIFGKKGRVHYEVAPCIDPWLDTIDRTLPKKEVFRIVAEHIDREIHSRYRLYPCNWIAMDELDGTDHSQRYSNKDRQTFEKYIKGQLSKVRVPNPDIPFLRERILTMYANPARNYLAAKDNDA